MLLLMNDGLCYIQYCFDNNLNVIELVIQNAYSVELLLFYNVHIIKWLDTA